ncbi:hypothetical protein DUNSADRAFT_13867, partial [Dunaliella salina]
MRLVPLFPPHAVRRALPARAAGCEPELGDPAKNARPLTRFCRSPPGCVPLILKGRSNELLGVPSLDPPPTWAAEPAQSCGLWSWRACALPGRKRLARGRPEQWPHQPGEKSWVADGGVGGEGSLLAIPRRICLPLPRLFQAERRRWVLRVW